ncbi:MAG: 4-(cytidine 5'-diphospho)-2-C-methyl-D-erythritol kinase [Deltaproteobacteria bacterium]|nr:4-(cytidine 5'-diphospho)-2-C-methyl-D-erythritol kinase [Deltaproteobacteria bacterium]
MTSPTILLSPAKVNLFLRVLRKRDDGYHDIITLMQPLTLHDEISIEVGSGDGISVSCDSAEVPDGSGNLACIAAEHLLKSSDIKKKIRIRIKKNIPVAAGLGGGSSNAATVLMGLNGALKAGLSEAELLSIGGRLGSDVPFFMLGGPALASGRGTELERVRLPRYRYVLINPGFKVSTSWAYNNLDLTKGPKNNILPYSVSDFNDMERLKDHLVNDLETVTLRKHPEISSLKKALMENGASSALMSGSGPTVFGLFRDAEAARSACKALKKGLDARHSVFLTEGIEHA